MSPPVFLLVSPQSWRKCTNTTLKPGGGVEDTLTIMVRTPWIVLASIASSMCFTTAGGDRGQLATLWFGPWTIFICIRTFKQDLFCPIRSPGNASLSLSCSHCQFNRIENQAEFKAWNLIIKFSLWFIIYNLCNQPLRFRAQLPWKLKNWIQTD